MELDTWGPGVSLHKRQKERDKQMKGVLGRCGPLLQVSLGPQQKARSQVSTSLSGPCLMGNKCMVQKHSTNAQQFLPGQEVNPV